MNTTIKRAAAGGILVAALAAPTGTAQAHGLSAATTASHGLSAAAHGLSAYLGGGTTTPNEGTKSISAALTKDTATTTAHPCAWVFDSISNTMGTAGDTNRTICLY